MHFDIVSSDFVVFDFHFGELVNDSLWIDRNAEEEHREHQQQARSRDEEREVHARVQDRVEDSPQLQE